jgi:hypothetical protein
MFSETENDREGTMAIGRVLETGEEQAEPGCNFWSGVGGGMAKSSSEGVQKKIEYRDGIIRVHTRRDMIALMVFETVFWICFLASLVGLFKLGRYLIWRFS